MSDDLEHRGRTRPPYRLADRASIGDGVPTMRGGSAGGHVDELVAAYALGALEPAERDDVDRHGRGCARCADLIAAERRIVGLLPLAVPSAIPAPDVKLALFARLAQTQSRRDRAIETAAPASDRGWALLPPTLTIPSSRPAVPVAVAAVPGPAEATRRRPRFGLGGAVLTVPLLMALVATGAWGWQLRGQVQGQNATANFGFDPGEEWRLVGDQGRGQLIIGADERNAWLRMDLDKPNAGGRYQLYGLNEEDEVVPLSELELDEQGRGEKVFPVSESLDSFQRVSVRARVDEQGGEPGEAVLSVRPNGSIGSQDPTGNSALP